MNEIEIESLDELQRGDIVRHKESGRSYIVDANYSEYVIAMGTMHISNPSEWVKIEK